MLGKVEPLDFKMSKYSDNLVDESLLIKKKSVSPRRKRVTPLIEKEEQKKEQLFHGLSILKEQTQGVIYCRKTLYCRTTSLTDLLITILPL